jgi:hypothetical protein
MLAATLRRERRACLPSSGGRAGASRSLAWSCPSSSGSIRACKPRWVRSICSALSARPCASCAREQGPLGTPDRQGFRSPPPAREKPAWLQRGSGTPRTDARKAEYVALSKPRPARIDLESLSSANLRPTPASTRAPPRARRFRDRVRFWLPYAPKRSSITLVCHLGYSTSAPKAVERLAIGSRAVDPALDAVRSSEPV